MGFNISCKMNMLLKMKCVYKVKISLYLKCGTQIKTKNTVQLLPSNWNGANYLRTY